MDKDSQSKVSPEEIPLRKKVVEEKTERSCKNARNNPPGILRLDFGRPRTLSSEFKFMQIEPGSPQPSVDRLSVTFAEESVKSDSSTKCNYITFNAAGGSSKMEKVHFPQNAETHDSDQEDYSASVNAIIQRRASTRRSRKRSGRRASSPFTGDPQPGAENGRRRSSVYTTSSGDTAITMDENLNEEVTQEEIFENIKLHKEVLSHVKMQPWNMRKKLKLVIQAKSYIKKHEGALQERLAQSHSTKDMLARWNIYLIKKWQRWKREIANLSMWFIPWELKIKEIESHFGSVVASYFIFLRWLFWVNIVISVVIISFVTIPEILTPYEAEDPNISERKLIPSEEKYNSTNFLTLWDFEGVFKYSPLFYGWYMMHDEYQSGGYKVPTAYFVTGLVVYAYSFFATLRKMAENSRMSKLSEKDDECIFSWKLFTAWDYMIGNAETAHNRVASIVMGFKEALLEEAEKNRESRNWKVICFRVLVNTLVICLLSFSVFAVIVVVQRSTEPEANSTVWRRNEITVVMSLITLIFPMLFEVLGFVEQYHPRKQLRLQLARIMVLNLLNLYTLIFALFYKILDMTELLKEFKNSSTESPLLSKATVNGFSTATVDILLDNTQCYCPDSDINDVSQSNTNAFLFNATKSLVDNFTNFTNIVAFPLIASSNLTKGYEGSKIFGRKLLGLNDTEENVYWFGNNTLLSNMNFTELKIDHVLANKVINNLIQYSKVLDVNETETDFTNLTIYDTNVTLYSQYNALINDNSNNVSILSNNSINSDSTDFLQILANNLISYLIGYSKVPDANGTETDFTNLTIYDTNETLYSQYNASTNDNYNNVSIYFNNSLISNSTDFLDLKDFFVDYLTYILSEFVNNDIDISLNTSNANDWLQNVTKILSEHEVFPKYLVEVIQQVLNVSDVDNNNNNITAEHERFDTATETTSTTTMYTTIISSPITSSKTSSTSDLPGTTTTTEFDIYCIDYCNSKKLKDTSLTNDMLASTALTSSASMSYTKRAKLRSLCWETMFGQELIKLTVMDLLLTVISTLAMDFFRGIFVRIMNRCWCWDLEKTFPQYGDFKVAENILHLVNNQGMVWMGMFFSPGLVVLNVVKLYIMMYLRAWAVLTCNVPHEVIFRASRSNNFYYALLLMMLFLCVLPVGYAIVWIEPSWHCGPFSRYNRIFRIFTKEIKRIVPEQMHKALDYIASPGIIIPLLVLLILIIYYLVSLTGALREANNDLKIQLRRERTEERRKMFQLADRRRRGGSGESNDLSSTPFTKWKKLIGSLPTGKSIDETPRQESDEQPPTYKDEKYETKGKDFFSKLIKKALGKSSTSDEDLNEDGTDNEQHDSLPYDTSKETRAPSQKPLKKSLSNNSRRSSGNEFNVLVHRVLSLKKSEGNGDNNGSSTNVTQPVLFPRRDTLDLKTRPKIKKKMSEELAKASASRQDSSASNWSENIPVITISKTESAENILDPDTKQKKNDQLIDEPSCSKTFKPKIKCALKKQTTEIDEETICHFDNDLQKIEAEKQLIRSLAEEELDDPMMVEPIASLQLFEESVSDRSTSEETDIKLSKSSDDTVLKSPLFINKENLVEEEDSSDFKE